MYNSICKTDKELKIKEYITGYIKELQRHFDLPDNSMRNILYQIYKEKSPMSVVLDFFKKRISMLKLFCQNKRK